MSQVVYFRASSFGNLMTESRGTSITEKQLETLNEFEDRIRNGGKPLTEKQKEFYLDLKAKRDAPPQLSDTAKSEIEKVWLLNEKGFWDDLNNKFLTKGLMNEQDGLELVSDYLNDFILKNDERKNEIIGQLEGTDIEVGLTGESDGFCEVDGKKVVIDIKASWNPKTFLNSKMSSIYEYQLRCYMFLYDVDEAWLCYCLTDTPQDLIDNEKKKTFYKYFSSSMSNEDVQLLEEKLIPIYEQIERNMKYSTNSAYKKEEMVKIYKISRDKEIEQKMLEKLGPAIEYYSQIKLNQQ